jgi:hypothetical protein
MPGRASLTPTAKNPELQFPGVTAHLASCGPCAHDFEGVLQALRDAVTTDDTA